MRPPVNDGFQDPFSTQGLHERRGTVFIQEGVLGAERRIIHPALLSQVVVGGRDVPSAQTVTESAVGFEEGELLAVYPATVDQVHENGTDFTDEQLVALDLV